MAEPEYSDVLIIGAGISGIGAAYRIHEKNPKLSYTVLERRARIGGTWDLNRYPGIRSDSDIFTLSYPVSSRGRAPRTSPTGDDIREYLTQTARKHGIDEHIRFNTRVLVCRLGFDDRHLDGADRGRRRSRRPTAAGSCSSAPATTTTTSPTDRISRAARNSRARSCIRSTGRSRWTTPARGWW